MSADPLLDEIVRRIVADFSPERIYLFGSRARADHRDESDYDLLVVKRCPHRRIEAQRIYRALAGIGRAKDVVVVTPEDLIEHAATPGFVIGEALSGGRILYAA